MSFLVLIVSFWLNIFGGFINEFSTSIDREQFYNSLIGNSLTVINKELAIVQATNFTERNAFEGTLLMKKAGLVGSPKEKLSTFKSGHALLESAIQSAPSNTEYRFLRLLIQENAPSFLGYKSNLEEDKKMIVDNYKSLPNVVQVQIKKYSATSKYLTPDLF